MLSLRLDLYRLIPITLSIIRGQQKVMWDASNQNLVKLPRISHARPPER
ncbi:hypothetical protein MOMMJLID_CDS0007 [Arthrobacter phage 1191A]|nr:hypothetical protein MOMMJLID_CDS0007 [Arthrobacter phage 1191A]